MSDYLWDGKSEPEPDVARLESLLGAYAHERRPLEWPAGAYAPEPPSAGSLSFWPRLRASRLFAPAALAAAAVLLVASVLAASAFLRARVPAVDERAAAPDPSRNEKRPAPLETEPRKAMLVPLGEVKDATFAVKDKDEKGAVGTPPRVMRRRNDLQLAATSKRRQREVNAPEAPAAAPDGGFQLEALNTRGAASTLIENARLLTKEQLVYALRFTGAKLRDVREKAQGEKK